MKDLVLTATAWPSNAEMVLDMVRLCYLKKTDLVMDLTHGRGVWWGLWRPDRLVTNDWRKGEGDIHVETMFDYDFRHMPEGMTGMYDVVAYDPPYVAPGGRKTSTIPDMHDRFGMRDTPKNPRELQIMMNGGLTEANRLARSHGLVLMKCANYVWGGRYWPGVFRSLQWADALGMVQEDQFVYVGKPGPQPERDVQLHGRSNHSMLLVLRATKKSIDEPLFITDNVVQRRTSLAGGEDEVDPTGDAQAGDAVDRTTLAPASSRAAWPYVQAGVERPARSDDQRAGTGGVRADP